MKIETVHLYRLKIPLQRPYKIATATMKDFDCTIVSLTSHEREGLGEAMAGVAGYFWETPEQVWQFAKDKGPQILNQSVSQAYDHISRFAPEQPCAATPFLTALEVISGNPLLSPPAEPRLVPLVGILQATEKEEIQREVEEFLSQAYGTIKIKVGFNAEEDTQKIRVAQEIIRGRALIRTDANQGYTLPQATKFVRGVNPAGIEFLEQPLAEDAWEDMGELARISPIPLGLDESIYGIEAVEKARQLRCARFLKFKLMKMGSAEALGRGMEAARNYGLEVILGNGAAGEITCYQEALVAARLMTRAGEMNGFLKQRESILAEPIKTRGGKILLEPGFFLRLDPRKVDQFAVDRRELRATTHSP